MEDIAPFTFCSTTGACVDTRPAHQAASPLPASTAASTTKGSRGVSNMEQSWREEKKNARPLAGPS